MRWPPTPKYSALVTCPTTATHDEREETELDVGQGRIAQVSVTWTPGSQWLNCLIIKYEGAQIIPSEGGGQCRGDGYPDTWPENIVLDKPHPKLTLEVWNEGNDYEHDVLVDIVTLPVEPDALRPIRDLVALLRRLIGV